MISNKIVLNNLNFYNLRSSDYPTYNILKCSVPVLIGEDTLSKKVYALINNMPKLIYDFSVKVGDTIEVYDLKNNKQDTIIFDSILYKQANITAPIRKYFYGHQIRDTSISFIPYKIRTYWVEGIGNSSSLFENVFYTFFVGLDDPYSDFICFKNGQNSVFPDTLNCNDSNVYPIAVAQIQKLNHLSIFPNPATQTLNISGNFVTTESFIYNKLGQLILQQNNISNTININQLPNDIYRIRIKSTSNALLYSGTFIKQ
jgi:Secretion system C-terminal sorting domain